MIHDNLSFSEALEVERAGRRRDAVCQLSEIRDFTLDGQSRRAEDFIDLAIECILELDAPNLGPQTGSSAAATRRPSLASTV